MKNKYLYVLFLLLILSCYKQSEKFEYFDFTPHSIEEIRKQGLYEYGNIETAGGDKNVFFSNVKPDYIFKQRNKPLGRMVFTKYNNKLPEVLKYFDTKLKNHFVYYHFRNDSLISKLYIVDNALMHNEADKVTNIDTAKNIMGSLNIEFNEREKEKNEFLLRTKFNYRVEGKKDQQIFLIDHKYPILVNATNKIFSIEVFYNKANTDLIDNWYLE